LRCLCILDGLVCVVVVEFVMFLFMWSGLVSVVCMVVVLVLVFLSGLSCS
jgi:hypothetical protein